MNDQERCPAVPEDRLRATVAAQRSAFREALAASCRLAAVEAGGPLEALLGARLDAFLDHFLPVYVKADLSARHHQEAYTRASALVFSLGALAVIIVAAQHLFHLPHLVVVGEVVCIGMILFVFHWGNHRRWHRNWVDCRYFAERLRCALHVAFLCGKTAVSPAPTWADRMVEGAWCNAAYREIMSSRPHPEPLPPAGLAVLKHFMVDHWLKAQARYHGAAARRNLRNHRTVSRLGELCFWLTLVTALLHLTPHAWRHAWHAERVLTDQVLTFVVIALPAIGTALAGVRGHFEFKKKAMRSRMIGLQLDTLSEEALAADDLAELSPVVLRAEELMIQESSGWHLHANTKSIPAEA